MLPRSASARLRALRPQQWTKNAVLFAGLVFAGRASSGMAWSNATAAFLAFCAVSSAAYLLNDVRDAESDRLHPAKRQRPIASGEITPRHALGLASVIAVWGLALGASVNWATLLFLAGFLGLQTLYTLVLKRIFLCDVLSIGGLFVIRAAAGAAAVNVHISGWLIVCTALLALFLGFAKRRAELVSAGCEGARRSVLSYYSVPLLDRLVQLTALAAAGSYSLYAFSAHESEGMAITIPFVAAGLLRYLYLIQVRGLGEEPDRILLRDTPILIAVGLWVTGVLIVLNGS